MEQLSDVESEDSRDETDDGEGDPNNPGSIKHRYQSSKWRQNDNTYDPPRMVFQGFGGPKRRWNRMPSFQTLFEMFWSTAMLLDIVAETNRYARAINGAGKLPGGENWKDLTLPEFKVFLAITLYMGMRKQPNVKSYWMKSPSIFHCSIISNLLSRDRFMVLTKCFHLANHDTYVRDRDLPGYDKMGQVRGICDQVRETFRNCWNLGKFLTIDEMMIRYKGTYCPARQYMPKKPQKWGIKASCLADSKDRYVYDFDIYCGRNGGDGDIEPERRGEANLAHSVVTKLMDRNNGKGHVVVMDNYFTSVGLFEELAQNGTYATGTIRTNRVGILQEFRKTGEFNRKPQGSLDWRMHADHGMASVIWKDKKAVLLLSTHAMPVDLPGDSTSTVPRQTRAVRNLIPTSPIHLEYTTYMRGVDVADQLRASYSCQTRSHKWWHRIFWFLLDTTVVNMYIYYLALRRERGRRVAPMTHLQFKTQFCENLTKDWRSVHRP